MLRLVEPPKEGQEKRTYTSRNAAFYPTEQESSRIRAAIRTLSRAHGGRDVLAKAMGVRRHLLTEVVCRKTCGSYGLAVLLARVAGISFEALLSPLKSVDVCPTCCGRNGAK